MSNEPQTPEKILENMLSQPHSVEDDAGKVEGHRLSDVTQAVKELRKMKAADSPLGGISLFTVNNGGTVVGGERE